MAKAKTKRTRKRTSKSKSTKPKARIIWAYAADERLVDRAVGRLLDFGSGKSNQLRKQLGISLDQPIIPIFPYPASPRVDVVEYLAGLKDAVVLVFGLTTDRKNKSLQSFYKHSEVIWFQPGERQFYIDMMSKDSSMRYAKSEKAMEEWLGFFEDHFSKENIHVIRNG